MKHTNSLKSLETAALKARRRAYAPYSHFQVGAAIESDLGQIFTGCNVENISFGLTICAERNAVFAAIAAGVRSFSRIVIIADSEEPVTPCGACRQVLSEFTTNIKVISFNLKRRKYSARLSHLLPRPKVGILNSCVPQRKI